MRKERIVNESESIKQVMIETTFNEKLLRGVQGGGFLEKSPLAAGGKIVNILTRKDNENT